jgi:indole-3-glycerol phosphate synthase/phosphoribosylanthranilate isomerase
MADGLLGEIVHRKRIDVSARFAGLSLGDLRARAEPTSRNLEEALRRPGARFIMEVKRSSPSAGRLRPSVDPAAMARAYRGAADAISVLTDAPFFGGSFGDLAAVRAEFDGPILAKDFIVDARQVAEARIHGADAVLVILSVLDDMAAAEVLAEARKLGMDVLVEAHDEPEVRRAIALGARIIGINNRNLKTLAVDLSVTERLARLVPEDRLLVSESGISSRADVVRLAPFAHAFLVGSSLMKAPDPAQAARELAFGRVKVCGLTDVYDAAMSADYGATYAGIVMVPNTPRAVDVAKAEQIAEAARRNAMPLVCVFRNEKVMQIAATAGQLQPTAVQLHGDEDAEYIRALRSLLPAATEIWAAAAVGREVPQPRPGADRSLFDTSVNGRSGGTGLAFDWARLEGRDLAKSIIAGGLRASSARAAASLGAYALDVSSGVEMAPGRKDAGKLHAFLDALRLPARAAHAPC